MAQKDQLDVSCGFQCNKLWDGFGNWVAIGDTMQWKPFVPGDGKTETRHMQSRGSRICYGPSQHVGVQHNFSVQNCPPNEIIITFLDK